MNAVRLPAGQHLRVLPFLCCASCYILFPDVGIAERSRQEESAMEKHSHLTLSERIEIEKALRGRAIPITFSRHPYRQRQRVY